MAIQGLGYTKYYVLADCPYLKASLQWTSLACVWKNLHRAGFLLLQSGKICEISVKFVGQEKGKASKWKKKE